MVQNSPMDYRIRCLHIPTGWYQGKWKYKKTEDGAGLTTQRWHQTRLQMVAFWKGQVNISEHSITLGRQHFFSFLVQLSATISELCWVADLKMRALGHSVFFARKESSNSAHTEKTPYWHWSLKPSRTVPPVGQKVTNAKTIWVWTLILLFYVHCLFKGCFMVSRHFSNRTSETD